MITYVKKSNADKYSNLYERATQALRTHTMDGQVCDPDSPLAILQPPKEGELDNSITSLEEYFSFIVELNKINSAYTILPLDEEVFTIDANSRAITVPPSFAQNGISVQGDEISEIVYFKIDRFYDATDLATKKIYIQWTSPSGKKGVSAPWVIDIESEPNFIIFGWPLSSAITEAAGTVQFAVRFYSIDEESEKINYSLATLNQTAQIKPSLDFDIENLATNGLMVDDCQALIDGRFEDTIPSGSSAIAGVPIWVVDIDDAPNAEHNFKTVTDAESGEVTIYAALTEDENGFTNLPYHAVAQALAPDAGQISYFWKGWDLTGSSIAVDHAVTFFETQDTVRQEGKLYYYKESSTNEAGEIVEAYKLWMTEAIDEDATASINGKLYEKFTSALIDKPGKYRATAKNRVRNAVSEAHTQKLFIPTPTQVTITKDLDDSNYFTEPNYSIELSVAGTIPVEEPGKITYQWYHRAPGATEAVAIEGENTFKMTVAGFVKMESPLGGTEEIEYVIDNVAVGDGYYFCIITNNLNTESIDTISNEIRITHIATKPTVNIVSSDSYTLAEIATEKAQLEVTAEIPVESGEMVEGWRTEDDTLTYQWYRFYTDKLELDKAIDLAAEGNYDVSRADRNLSVPPAGVEFTEEQIAATRQKFYDPTEAGYYFCAVTNTYNGTKATRCSRFFSVADA